MLTLITCTGGRPEAFALLESWVCRQVYSEPFQWIVVDDCDPATELRCGQRSVRPQDRWRPGENTLARNLRAALPFVAGEKILFLEDDDYYGPGYLAIMDRFLETKPVVGQRPARYYNVAARRYREFANVRRASLCQTGIRAEEIPLFDRLCAIQPTCIDFALWSSYRDGFAFEDDHVVGIKGMPGRKGIGVGHDPNDGVWYQDPDLYQLRAWLGRDAEAYVQYCGVLTGV